MRHALVLLLPLLALAACDRAGFERSDGSFDREGYKAQSVDDCRGRLQRDNSSSVPEAERTSLCTCIVDAVFAGSNDDQLREYYRNGGIPREREQQARLQCPGGLAVGSDEETPPPPDEPPPSMSGDVPPPLVRQGTPQPSDGPAPGGGEMADGPDAGGGASAPGGTRARVRAGSLAQYLSADDYPAAALRNNEQGRVQFILDIGADGRVTTCAVTETSGSATLDSTTCRIMRSRPRYTPARNALGRPVADRDRGAVRWALPD